MIINAQIERQGRIVQKENLKKTVEASLDKAGRALMIEPMIDPVDIEPFDMSYYLRSGYHGQTRSGLEDADGLFCKREELGNHINGGDNKTTYVLRLGDNYWVAKR